MKRIPLVLLVALAAGLTLPLAGSAAEGDSPRACADLREGAFAVLSGNYVQGDFQTAAPLCNGGVSLTIFVNDGTTTTALSPTTVIGTFHSFAITFDPTVTLVCVYAEVSVGRGHHIIDRIPDTGTRCLGFGGTVFYDYPF